MKNKQREIPSGRMRSDVRIRYSIAASALALLLAGPAGAADDVRYSWFEISYLNQDVGSSGSQTDVALGQTVDLDTDNGGGIQFRASLGTWHNFYTFVHFGSTDIDDEAVVTNAQGTFPATDEFDLTSIRGGVGYRIPLNFTTDLYGEVSYDSLDFDFGSFAGESFDTDDQGIGAAAGIRTTLKGKLELKAYGRYTDVGDVDLSNRSLDSDILFGGGFGFELLRGLSLTGEYETGELESWSIGFRLDLSED
jgi:hypothetical protein